MLKLVKNEKGHRIGNLRTKNGVINTPFFMPIATKGTVRTLCSKEVEQIGFEAVLGNTYHLWLKPGDDLIKSAGGLHTFMNWKKSILTDSGGYQVFSLGAKVKKRSGQSKVKITEDGVNFSDPKNGKKYFMSPEDSIKIQLNLDSDIIMCLDECPPYPCSYEDVKKSLALTTRWAERCKKYFNKLLKENNISDKRRPLLFGIVQGSNYKDLREESAHQLIDIGFDGYAIGGVAVGEPREEMKKILRWVIPILPKNKPRYLMGLGRPEELVLAVKLGVDMFDCVIPTREGRHGRLFTWKKNPKEINIFKTKEDNFYETININNQKFKKDFSKVSDFCDCELCKNYSKAYLRHLFTVKESLGGKLATLHNLNFYWKLLEKMGRVD